MSNVILIFIQKKFPKRYDYTKVKKLTLPCVYPYPQYLLLYIIFIFREKKQITLLLGVTFEPYTKVYLVFLGIRSQKSTSLDGTHIRVP